MVRCALDLGLRRGEIAGLALEDIDWRAGTIRLRRTKGGREDILPLPDTTGCAIADYLRLERPHYRQVHPFINLLIQPIIRRLHPINHQYIQIK